MNQNDARKIETHLACQSANETGHASSESKESWEQEQYACYYNYLFSLMKNANLHYEKVGKRSGLKERHIEEVLTFRLKPSRQKAQLIGYREGSCYICKNKIQNSGPVEPVCLKCLKMIELACLEIEEDAALLMASSKPASTPLIEETVSEVASEPELTEANPAMVPATLLQATQAELACYKTYFGNLPPEAQPEVTSALSQTQTHETLPQKEITTESGLSPAIVSPPMANDEPINETEQLLKILAVNDQELASETADLTDLLKTILPNNNMPLRHFGFQRSKSYKLP